VVSTIFGVYALSYAVNTVHIPRSTMLWVAILANVAALIAIPLWAMLSDRYGRKPIFIIGAIAPGLLMFPFLWAISQSNVPLIFGIGILMSGVLYSASNGVWPSFYGEMFSTRVRLSGIRNHKGREMDAPIAGHGEIELSRKRRRSGLEQHLDIAAREHGADIAGPGQRAIRIDLDRHRRRRKAAAHERMARGLAIRHEVANVIEENLLAKRQLTVGLGSFGVHHQLFVPMR